jgi:hypothetical protein
MIAPRVPRLIQTEARAISMAFCVGEFQCQFGHLIDDARNMTARVVEIGNEP